MKFFKKHGWLVAGFAGYITTMTVVDSRVFMMLIVAVGFLASRNGALLGKSLCALSALFFAMEFFEEESVREWLQHMGLTPNMALMLLVSPSLVWKLWLAARSNIHELQGRGAPVAKEAE